MSVVKITTSCSCEVCPLRAVRPRGFVPRLGRRLAARDSYEKALAPARQGPERGFLAGRLREIEIKNWLCFRFFLCATTALGASQIRDFYSLLDGSQSSILLPSGSLTHAKFP